MPALDVRLRGAETIFTSRPIVEAASHSVAASPADWVERLYGLCASWWGVWVIVLLSAAASAVSAQPAPGSAASAITLTGHAVRPDGTPVPHVLISLFGTTDTASTRDDGGFVLHPPEAGAYMIGARGLGLREERFAVTLAAGATRDLTITMVPFVPVLPRVVTTAEERAAYVSVGFDQRKRMGVGEFLTYDQIQRAHPSTFTQLLQGVRGIVLNERPLQSRSSGTGVSASQGGGCMSYVVDGSPQQQITGSRDGAQDRGGESPDNFIDVSQVGAVEVYSSAERPSGFGGMDDQAPPPTPPDRGETANPQIPGQAPQLMSAGAQQASNYLPKTPCGLVMVWTRSRLGITDPGPSGATNPSLQKTAPHDVMQGLSPFTHSSCTPPPATDTMALLVYASVQGPTPSSMSDSAWAVYRDQVLAGLARASDLPSETLLPTFGLPGARGTPQGIPTGNSHVRFEVAPVLSTVLSFTLDGVGKVKDVHVAASALSGGADTSAMAMIEQAAAAHAFPRVTGQRATPDSIHLYLVLQGAEPAAGAQAAVLGQLEVPVWRLTRQAHLVSGGPKKGGGSAHDSVTVTVVVDSTGQVASGSARFEVAEQMSGSTAVSSQAHVLQMLPGLRFEPAMIGSCRVNALVMQSFATKDVLATAQ